MLKLAKWLIITIIVMYVGICLLIYFSQEKLIFFPERLSENYRFTFSDNFEEINVKMRDGNQLNCLLFKANKSKGLIFYLHGNGGSLRSWGDVAQTYTSLGYDVFMPDYRGYGKNRGHIDSEKQLFNDCQTLYSEISKRYNPNSIVILGYSIGTGLAAHLASENTCKALILQAPYYNFIEMKREHYPFLPNFILRYKLETNRFIKSCKAPVIIFHGNADELIPYSSSVKLKQEFKPGDTLITLAGQGHNGITDNPDYLKAISSILK